MIHKDVLKNTLKSGIFGTVISLGLTLPIAPSSKSDFISVVTVEPLNKNSVLHFDHYLTDYPVEDVCDVHRIIPIARHKSGQEFVITGWSHVREHYAIKWDISSSTSVPNVGVDFKCFERDELCGKVRYDNEDFVIQLKEVKPDISFPETCLKKDTFN